jgi:AmmeMemoRadiSam system protein A
MTSSSDRRYLLQIAREAIAAHVNGSPAPRVKASGDLGRPAAAFVTIHEGGELRGCIGHLQPDQPLAMVVAQCAVAACSSDPRFPPVTPPELAEVEIELSILGALEPLSTIDEIDIGRHGLLVEDGSRRGLLLPQVATEWQWDRKTFVEQTCHKAGLPRDAWQHGAKISRFEAEVFGEKDL